jgi:oligo-alginate lyase
MKALSMLSSLLALVLGLTAVNAHASSSERGVQVDAAVSCPLFDAEVERAARQLQTMIASGVQVPMPRDPGGGYTHELHKRNGQAVYQGGLLYQITGDTEALDYVRQLLLAYAELYPQLGPHPAAKENEAGRLFWQNLNDSVWLVYAIQGYEAVRDALTPAERARIESGLLHPAAEFLSDGSPRTFGRIHNHATWAAAAVGMTGYVLGDQSLIDKALLGPARDGKAGLLRQLDLLFSPDGYYTEGPYYQRYALLPFLVFAESIDRHEPGRKIFAYRDQILIKALRSTIALTYGGYFFPINDALKDKSLNTEELYQGVALGYAQSGESDLLSIAQGQGRTSLTAAGRHLACALAQQTPEPFSFRPQLFRDGPDGKAGALALLRRGDGAGQALLAKNSAQGMGHGHYDKLAWLYYDNGHELIRDYGAARFLNIEAKHGGHYLPENQTWAKQTIAHNTLVVDQRSHFDGDLKRAEATAPQQLWFEASEALQISSARIDDAYPGTRITRTLALLPVTGLSQPLVIDLLRFEGEEAHTLDLPLHYQGQIMRVGAKLQSHVSERTVLGRDHGYQHIWVDARAKPSADQAFVTWLLADRFYTWRWLPQAGAELILGESGANDPQFNLRREPLLIQRTPALQNAVFVGVLEAHGRYDGATEQTSASDSQIRSLKYKQVDGMDVVTVETLTGSGVIVALSHDPNPEASHRLMLDGRQLEWRGYAARFELDRGGVER